MYVTSQSRCYVKVWSEDDETLAAAAVASLGKEDLRAWNDDKSRQEVSLPGSGPFESFSQLYALHFRQNRVTERFKQISVRHAHALFTHTNTHTQASWGLQKGRGWGGLDNERHT